MCGIVGYVGTRKCRQFILDGLSRLEYRGYDSAGIACIDEKHKHISFKKKTGGSALLKDLSKAVKFDGYVGIGHTRWATHGVTGLNNAHPHFSCENDVAIVHNGIIEGYDSLRDSLIQKGHNFTSSTDSEVVAHLFSDLIKQSSSLTAAVTELVNTLKGAYSLAILSEKNPDTVVAIRNQSPLCIGRGEAEAFIASDFMAFSDQTRKVCFMPESSFALCSQDGEVKLYDFQGRPLPINLQEVDLTFSETGKQGFEHYMLKEIYEQKRAITRTVSFCKIIGSTGGPEQKKLDLFSRNKQSEEYSDSIWRQLGVSKEYVAGLKRVHIIGSGTSWHAARIAQFYFEQLCNIPTRVHLSSEFQHMRFFPEEKSLYIMISQSGETADTLQALRLINSFDLPTIGITNVASSTIVREASGFLPMQAGPEISVASTKAFSTQLATLYWLANRCALEMGEISWSAMHEAEEELYITAEILETVIETYKLKIKQILAPKYAQYKRFIFLGRHISYPFALEADLKLKEISYIFSQSYPAGELKHGPIALIDDKTPVIIFSVIDVQIYEKIVANAQEVKARKGHLVVFAFEGQKELIKLADTAFIIPLVKPLLAPLAMTGLMQFFTYQITKSLNRPIDKPRNLAKSVTVE